MAFSGCARKISGLLKLPNSCIKHTAHLYSQPSFSGKQKKSSLIIMILSDLVGYYMSSLINVIELAESSLDSVHVPP